MDFVLYNPHSGNGMCLQKAQSCQALLGDDSKLMDMTEIASYRDFFGSLSDTDRVVLCGGDGTLNRFINDVEGLDISQEILYFPAGTGNDFAADVEEGKSEKPFSVNQYIKDLPTVCVKGKTYRFLNGVGFGIDGYCCEVGDELRRQGKTANYTAIAIKGLLFHFAPVNAEITVDGREYTYKKVWIAPTMHGRRYGGGMIPTPGQRRNSDSLSVMIFHGSGRLHTLQIFPSIFKGEHVLHKKQVSVIQGKQITVKFDRPTALQIDGETILGVEEYTACVSTVATEKKEQQACCV